MPRATAALFARINAVSANLEALQADLKAAGDHELEAVVKRARRELQHPAFTGAENTRGVNAHAVRR